MNDIVALLDSNVLIAALLADHQDHAASAALFEDGERSRYGIAAHSIAEAYATLTRPFPRGFAVAPADAVRALDQMRAESSLLGLTAAQTMDGIRAFAAAGGTGPRLYDRLIGEVALAHGIPAIVTWNLRHMAGLFPGLRVVTPREYRG